jgi:uncharacterized protein (TIGR00299 family) protein
VRIAYLDLVSGISGDMFVGALLDAGWPEDALRRVTGWMGDEIAALRIETRVHQGIRGRGIAVEPGPRAPRHRSLDDVLRRLDAAPLAPELKARAGSVFRRLADAEARAHGCAVDAVRFHEIGAVDALVDVIAACAGLGDLGIERLHVSAVPLGAGRTQGSHGAIPLPGPATAFLLEGAPIRWTGVEGERCTPTGAALAASLGTWSPPPPMTLRRVGCGAGARSFPDVPNIARLFLGDIRLPEAPTGAAGPGDDAPHWGWESSDESPPCPGRWDRVAVLETQIDEATPQEVAWLAEELRAAPALDVLVRPVGMKKGRTGFAVAVICRPAHEAELMALLLTRSPTLGVRRRLEWRRELERETGEVPTRFGPVLVKLARRGEGWTAEPEYESCRRVAREAGVGLREVWRAAQAAAGAAPGGPVPARASLGPADPPAGPRVDTRGPC